MYRRFYLEIKEIVDETVNRDAPSVDDLLNDYNKVIAEVLKMKKSEIEMLEDMHGKSSN